MLRFLLPLALFGCASEKSMDYFDEAEFDLESEAALNQQIHIDIYPADGVDDLLPQTFTIDSSIQNLQNISIEMNPTIDFSGQVEGFSIYPHNDDVSVPGQTVQVQAHLQLSKANSISNASVNTDENGKFQILAPAETDYDLTITPIYPSDIPFEVNEQFDLSQSQDLNIDLGFGQPIYGNIIGLENHIDQAYVQLIDTITGLRGPHSALEEDASFLLRAPTDRTDFILRIQGYDNETIPTVDIPFRIEPEADLGQALEIDIGEITPVFVQGDLLQPDGSIFRERAEINFTSIELYNAQGELTIKTNNDAQGNFSTQLLPGRWRAEFIPAYGDDQMLAPTEIEFTIDDDTSVDLGDVLLRSKVRLYAKILDTEGFPSSDVIVSMQEVSFNQNIYSATTDADGRIEMQVPPVGMKVTLKPSDASSAITHLTIAPPEEGQETQWSLQKGTPIRGQVEFENQAIPYALIEIRRNQQVVASSLTDSSGNFNLRVQVDE